MLKQNARILTFSKVVSDALFLVLAFLASWTVKFSILPDSDVLHLPFEKYAELIYLSLPSFLILQNIFQLYKPLRTKTYLKELSAVLFSCTILLAIVLVYLFIFKIYDISHMFVGLFCVFSFLFIGAERLFIRLLLRYFRKKGYNIKHVLLIGLTDLGKSYLDAIKRHAEMGYHAIGYLDNLCRDTYHSVPFLGTQDRLLKILEKNTIDEVIIALPLEAYSKLSDILSVCEMMGVKSVIIPAYTRFVPAKPQIDEIDSIPLVNTRYIPLDNILYACIKYGFDFIFSALLLVVLSPVMLLCALCVRLSSKGSVLFAQKRIGYNGKPFMIYKFRTMYQNEKTNGKGWTTRNDARVTPVGKFLRWSYLDELPQLFNVLKGQMSLIGPRPEQPHFVEAFKNSIPKYMIKHRVRPGMTGWAQVNGYRGDTSIEKRILHDIYYIENWSILFDIKIFFLTFFAKKGY